MYRDGEGGSVRDTDLIELTVAGAAAALRERACSCREYVEALIARSESMAGLNAFVSHDWDALLAAARAVDGGAGAGTRGPRPGASGRRGAGRRSRASPRDGWDRAGRRRQRDGATWRGSSG